jgi:hypothetical protein
MRLEPQLPVAIAAVVVEHVVVVIVVMVDVDVDRDVGGKMNAHVLRVTICWVNELHYQCRATHRN